MIDPVSVGIDVSKRQLDVAIVPSGHTLQVPNTPAGWQHLVAVVGPLAPTWIVCEATSKLHQGVAVALTDAGLLPSVVNPGAVKHFRKAIGKHGKTDLLDAAVLAQYGLAVQPAPKPAPAAHVRTLAELRTRHQQLTDDRAREQIRKDAAMPALHERIDAHIAFLSAELAVVDQAIDDLLAADPALAARRARLRTVPGIGRYISAVLTIDLPELGQTSHKALAALVGVAPFNRDSGGARGVRYTYGGRAAVRTALYQAVTSALRHRNQVLKTFYTRLRERGKPHKLAVVACMNKLLGLLNAMVRDGLDWSQLTSVMEVHQP